MLLLLAYNQVLGVHIFLMAWKLFIESSTVSLLGFSCVCTVYHTRTYIYIHTYIHTHVRMCVQG